LVPIAEGFEEIEAICVVDILRRAGAKVTLCSIMGRDYGMAIKGQNGISILADKHIDDVYKTIFDLISLPGGKQNAELSAKSELLI